LGRPLMPGGSAHDLITPSYWTGAAEPAAARPFDQGRFGQTTPCEGGTAPTPLKLKR
jgi:hypothetical protein